MGFTNIQAFQKEMNLFIERDVPQDFIRRQIECAIFLQGELVDLSWDVLSSEWSTQHSIRNWQLSVDDEPQNELGTSLRSWQPGSEKSDAVPLSDQEQRASLEGRFKTGANFASMSTIWVYNKASRLTKDGNHFYYMQQLADGHSDLIPRQFMRIAIANTIEFMRAMGRKSDMIYAFKHR